MWPVFGLRISGGLHWACLESNTCRHLPWQRELRLILISSSSSSSSSSISPEELRRFDTEATKISAMKPSAG